MQYLLHDLIKLPMQDRLYIIEKVITSLAHNEKDLSHIIERIERHCSIGLVNTLINKGMEQTLSSSTFTER